jgi:CHASE2 domain-containing sensor protein
MDMAVVGRTTIQKVDQFMSQDMLDKASRRELNQQLLEIEKAIFDANQKTIRERVPALNRESFIRFAEMVADTRANYVRMALEISKLTHQPESAIVAELKRQREAYDELLAAFEAMQRLIERGYVRLSRNP